MSASGIRMGKVYVEIGADQKALNKALANIQKQTQAVGKSLQSLGTRMMGFGLAAASGLAAATKMFADAGDSLRDMSLRTGASVEALSSLGFVASQSGVSMQDLEGGMRKMQKALAAAQGGNKEASQAFADLGLSVDELSRLSPDEQLLRIGDSLAAIKDPALRAAMAMRIFGKGGTALLPMLREGSAAIRQMQADAEQLGIVMSTDDANAADALNDSLARLRYIVNASVHAIGASLAPVFTALSDAVAKTAGRIVRFVRDNARMVRVALLAAGALTLAGAAAYAFGTALVAASSAFSKITQAASVLVGPLRLLANLGVVVGQSLLVALSGAINFGIGAAIAMVALLGPIGLVVAAIGGIAAVVGSGHGASFHCWRKKASSRACEAARAAASPPTCTPRPGCAPLGTSVRSRTGPVPSQPWNAPA